MKFLPVMASSQETTTTTGPHGHRSLKHEDSDHMTAPEHGDAAQEIESVISSPSHSSPRIDNSSVVNDQMAISEPPSNSLSAQDDLCQSPDPGAQFDADVVAAPRTSRVSLTEVSIVPTARPNSWNQLISLHRLAMTMILILLSGALVGGTLVIIKLSNEKSQIAYPNTSNSSTIEKQKSLFVHLRDALAGSSDPTNFLVPSSPQYRALEWLSVVPQEPTFWEEKEQNSRLVQRYALIVVSFSFTNGDLNWFDVEMLDSFGAEHECFWTFVTCNDDKIVTRLDLNALGLRGSFPEEIGELSGLSFLHAAGNFLEGDMMPLSSFSKLTNLQELGLGVNEISSSIPSEIGLLSNSLTFLDISYNLITGTIPLELMALSKLEFVDFSSNLELQGQIFDFVPFWPHIKELFIGMTRFTGSLPQGFIKQNLSNLYSLDVTALPQFRSIPSTIGLLTNLEYLHFGSRSDTHDDSAIMRGTIPTEIGQLRRMRGLVIKNTFISGSLPSEIGLLTMMEGFELSFCNISSTIPTEITMLSALKELSLAGNWLSGTVPTGLGLLQELTSLSIVYNRNIVIPNEICSGSLPLIVHSCDQVCDACCLDPCV